MKSFSLSVLVVCLLAGCASKDPVGENGGLLSLAPVSRVTNDAVAILGNLTGTTTAKDLDYKDKLISAELLAATLQSGEAGRAAQWRNPSTGHFGEITPGPVYSVNDYTCRDYVHHIVIGERQETLRQTACHQPDGSWRALI